MMRFSRWLLLSLTVFALTACGGGGGGGGGGNVGTAGASSSSSSGSSSSSSSGSSSGGAHNFSGGGSNVVPMTVGPGPGSTTAFNIPTTSVTVCLHGTSTCTTVDKVLVDTGSYGLRVLASALGSFSAPLQTDPNVSGNVIVECQQFLDGYTWGPVALVDVVIGGETASNIPINVLDDKGTLEPPAPSTCVNSTAASGGSSSGGSSSSSGGTNLSSVNALGANGVLGIGYLKYDCDAYCALPVASQTSGYIYYSCSSSSCAPTSEYTTDQVVNPVAMFGTDNNGAILQLPNIPASGQTTATGYVVFGIGTRSNNALAGATVLTVDTAGYITTTYNGQSLTKSFLDSGSNGYFFPDSSINVCTSSTDFYCPTTSPLTLTATNTGANGATTADLSMQIINVDRRDASFYAIEVGGPDGTGLSSAFDFGLPFFYGRTVFTAIEAMNAGGTNGPYFAY